MATGLGNRSSRYLNWMGGASPHQWELVQSDTQEHQQLRLSRNRDNTHILNYHGNISLLSDSGCRSNGVQADSRNSLFGCNDLQGVQSTTGCQPRQFIDAWSTEDRWFPTITATTKPSNPTTVATTTSKSSASKLPLSPLSLSTSGGSASAGNEIDPIWMGLSVSDSDGGEAPKPHQGPIWMLPASWQSSSPLGGPLAEVLQSSSNTPMAPNSPKVSGGKSSPAGLNMRTDGWGDASPGGSPRLDSSPTGVLQKTLAAFSDSSSSSSPTFGAKSEFALQWLSQQMPKMPSS